MEFEQPFPTPERRRRKKSAESDSEHTEKEPKKPHSQEKQDKKESTEKPPVRIGELLKQPQQPPEAVLAERGESKSKKRKKKKRSEAESVESETPKVDEQSVKSEQEDTADYLDDTDKEHNVDEGIADTIEAESDKKSKSKKGRKKPEQETPANYKLDEIVELELAGGSETVIPLRLPEVSYEQPHEPLKEEPEAEGWSFTEALDRAEEKLAAEDAGVALVEHQGEVPVEQEIEPTNIVNEEAEEIARQFLEKEPEPLDSVQPPEEILASVSQAYEVDEGSEGGEGRLPEPVTALNKVEKTTTIERPTQIVKESASPNVLKKLSTFEDFTHQKLKHIRQFTQKTFEQTKFPNRRDERLDQIFEHQIEFEDRRLTADKKQEVRERLILNKAAQFSKEDLPEEARLIQERLELSVPEEHRLERSAWLSFEVDKKTGRAVGEEASVIDYGREYYHEKQQEIFEAAPAEAAVASGQLAVGGSGTVNAGHRLTATTKVNDSTQKLATKTRDLYNKLESTIPIRNYRANSAGDLALAAALLVVVTAIILVA